MGLDLAGAEWRKSIRSGANGCVEVAVIDNQVCVRDAKDRDGRVLIFTPIEWMAFVDGVRIGEFDLPSQA